MAYPTLVVQSLACIRQARKNKEKSFLGSRKRVDPQLGARFYTRKRDVCVQEAVHSPWSHKLRRRRVAGPKKNGRQSVRRTIDVRATVFGSESAAVNDFDRESDELLLPHPVELEYGQIRFDEEFAVRNRDLPNGERVTRVAAEIVIPVHANVIWTILADIDFVGLIAPELARNEIMSKSGKPCVLKQAGLIQSVYWQLGGIATIEFREKQEISGTRFLEFRTIDGDDFEAFEGRWIVQSVASKRRKYPSCLLRYEVQARLSHSVLPHNLDRIIRLDLPSHLRTIVALSNELESLRRVQAQSVSPGQGHDFSPNQLFNKNMASPAGRKTVDAVKMTYTTIAEFAENFLKKWSAGNSNRSGKSEWLGIDNVPLPGSSQDKTQTPLPWSEVHIRRLDKDSWLHRRIVAAVEIDYPPSLVWDVLTDYSRLSEFFPHLLSCRILPVTRADFDRYNMLPSWTLYRLEQVGCKFQPYMCLKARAVLDVIEKPSEEIVFILVDGDYEIMQGAWRLQSDDGGKRTMMKYIADIRIKSRIGRYNRFFVNEPLKEEIFYTDIPNILSAIRDRVTFVAQEREAATRRTLPRDAPPSVLDAAIRDFVRKYGTEGIMPRREELRLHQRSDIERAIAKAGGFAVVAARMGMTLPFKQKKPKGYWNDISNIRREVSALIADIDGDPNRMPTRSEMLKAGYTQLARALEKWGGLQAVAEILELEVSRQSRKASK